MPITIKTYLGRSWTFDSLDEAVVHINKSFKIDNLRYGYLRCYATSLNYTYGSGDDVVFYDEIDAIPLWRVKEAFYNLPEEVREPTHWYWVWRKRHVKPEHFRCRPVPYVGRSRWRGRDRKIRTLQERKANEALELDEDAQFYNVKGRRQILPDDRDDYCVYVGKQKNWKKYRRNQWR